MTPDNFCYWLQGFFELSGNTTLTEEQVIEIKKHLYNVFLHKCEFIKYDSSTKKFIDESIFTPFNTEGLEKAKKEIQAEYNNKQRTGEILVQYMDIAHTC